MSGEVARAVKALRQSKAHMPVKGQMWLNPGNNEIRVYDGTDWITCSEPYHETTENYFRDKFEGESEYIHEQHPDLKVLWEEYRILRRLKTGE